MWKVIPSRSVGPGGFGMAPGEENRRVRAVLAYLTETSLR